EADMDKTVGKIVQAGAIPVIFKDNPYYEPDMSQCILHKKRGWIAADTDCSIPYQFVRETQEPVDRIIDHIAAKYPGTLVIDPKRVMCNDKTCVTHMMNKALYKDSHHINAKASALLADVYSSRVENPFASSATMSTGGVQHASLRQPHK